MAISYVVGAIVSGWLFRHYDARRIMDWSVALVVVGGALALGLVLAEGITIRSLLLPMGVLMVVAGSTTPGAMAGAVNLFPNIAGTASGLSSAIGIVIGGMFTVLGGMLYHGDYLPVAMLITTSATLTAASWLMVRVALARRAGPKTN
ncbi:MAG: hypothetical protein P8008_06075 [Gammaproteobacteria bacterium]